MTVAPVLRKSFSVLCQTTGVNSNNVWLVSRTVYEAAGRTLESHQIAGLRIGLFGSGNLRTSRIVDAGRSVTSSRTDYDSAGRAVLTTDADGLESRTHCRFGRQHTCRNRGGRSSSKRSCSDTAAHVCDGPS